jgi:hypothetical protein
MSPPCPAAAQESWATRRPAEERSRRAAAAASAASMIAISSSLTISTAIPGGAVAEEDGEDIGAGSDSEIFKNLPLRKT